MKRQLAQSLLKRLLPQAHRRERVRNWLSAELTLETVKGICINNNIDIKVIYDVGASNGSWSLEVQREFKNSKFVLFEANQNYRAALDDTGFCHFPYLLAEKTEQRLFYGADDHGDSLYRDKSKKYQQISAQPMQAYALDDVISDHSLEIPDFLKIDTQGSEIEILKGAKRTLEGVSFLYLECPILNCNEGAPNILEYLEVASSNNFVPVQIGEIHRTNNDYLVQIDILFANSSLMASTPY